MWNNNITNNLISDILTPTTSILFSVILLRLHFHHDTGLMYTVMTKLKQFKDELMNTQYYSAVYKFIKSTVNF